MALGTVTYAEHDHVLQELFHERLRARNLEATLEREREGRRIAERRLRGAHTALVEIERLALSASKDTREQILSEAQGALRETDPLNMRGAVKAALDRQVEQLLAGSPPHADASTRREPTQAEREAFWNEGPPDRYYSVSAPEMDAKRPAGDTRIRIKLQKAGALTDEHEMEGPYIGIPTRGADWVWVLADPGPTSRAAAQIERLTDAIEAAARVLETKED